MLPRDVIPRIARAVRTQVPDAPEQMLLQDAATALAKLLGDMKVMRRTIVLDLQQGVPDYLLDECPGDNLRWRELIHATINGAPYTPRPELAGVTTCYGGGQQVIWDREQHTITVSPTPLADATGALVLELVVTTDGAIDTPVADTIAGDQDFQDAWVAGAVARAFMDLMPKAAADHRILYDRLLTSLTTRRMMGWSNSDGMRMSARGWIAR